MERICAKDGCNNVIPKAYNGKYVNKTRIFCFDCSPFGSKNNGSFGKPKSNKKKELNYSRVKKHRKNRKLFCVEYKDGKCLICGYNKCMSALDFHHLDPLTKDFNISNKSGWSIERVKIELDKCILVCNRCHQEIHSGLIDLNENFS